MYAYDFETLAVRLRMAGFQEIHKMSFQTSHAAALQDDLANHRPYSLYVEAIK